MPHLDDCLVVHISIYSSIIADPAFDLAYEAWLSGLHITPGTIESLRWDQARDRLEDVNDFVLELVCAKEDKRISEGLPLPDDYEAALAKLGDCL